MTIGCAQQRASVVYIGLGRQELSSRRQIHCLLMTFGCTRKRSGVFCTSFGCTRNLFGCPCDNFAEVLHTFGCHPPLGLYNNKPKRGRRTRQWLNDLAARAQHCTGCPWAKWATFTTGMSTKKLERPFRAPFRGGFFFLPNSIFSVFHCVVPLRDQLRTNTWGRQWGRGWGKKWGNKWGGAHSGSHTGDNMDNAMGDNMRNLVSCPKPLPHFRSLRAPLFAPFWF